MIMRFRSRHAGVSDQNLMIIGKSRPRSGPMRCRLGTFDPDNQALKRRP
jgi:hypothetical protein